MSLQKDVKKWENADAIKLFLILVIKLRFDPAAKPGLS